MLFSCDLQGGEPVADHCDCEASTFQRDPRNELTRALIFRE